MNKKKMLAALALVGSLSMVTACGSGGDEPAKSSEASSSQEGGQSQAAAPSPDLNGVPDVVATVNGKDISKDEFTRVYESQFQQATMQAQMTGEKVDQNQMKKDAAESMVGSELLLQRAEQENITATKKQTDKALAEAAKSNQMSSKDFLAALKKQGMDSKTVDSQLKQQVEVEALVTKEAGPFSASEKEMKAAYAQAKAQQEQQAQGQSGESGQAATLPAYKEVKSQLKEQVVTQKQNAATQKLVEKLRKGADVKINI